VEMPRLRVHVYVSHHSFKTPEVLSRVNASRRPAVFLNEDETTKLGGMPKPVSITDSLFVLLNSSIISI
jgi:hypothetical protein